MCDGTVCSAAPLPPISTVTRYGGTRYNFLTATISYKHIETPTGPEKKETGKYFSVDFVVLIFLPCYSMGKVKCDVESLSKCVVCYVKCELCAGGRKPTDLLPTQYRAGQ